MKRIENFVHELLIKHHISKIPIPVRKLAKRENLFIRSFDLGPGVSGALLLDKDNAVIGINPTESNERIRFTIAHELGHFLLHKKTTALFVDNAQEILFRNDKTSSGELKLEREANAFAAALLMPFKFLVKEINNIKKENDYKTDDEVIKELAKRFKVSQIAMTYRLTNLGFFH